MATLAVIAFTVAIIYFLLVGSSRKSNVSIAHLPERFIVFDLETTGLDPGKHEIIEFGAIRINRDSVHHDTFHTLVRPRRRVPKRITELTGISQAMLDVEGEPIEVALRDFLDFAGNLHLVSFNADFDMAFLRNAAAKQSVAIHNPVSCALRMSRRAWPGRKSYRLVDLARDGNLDCNSSHRALADCQRALIVYTAAASKLGSVS